MLRAGWAGGMLRAPKLYQSVSISGPSATSKPMPTKTSSSSSRVWVTRWRWPRAAGRGCGAGRRTRSGRSGAGHLGGQLGWPRSRSAAASSRPRRWCGPRAAAARAPCGPRASRAPRPRDAWASGDFLPDTAAATSRMSSVESAAAMAARASPDQGVDVEGRGHGRHPVPAVQPVPRVAVLTASIPGIVERRCRLARARPPGTAAQSALAQGLEAQDGGRHAHVERLRPAGHGDGDPCVQAGRPRASRPAASLPKTRATGRPSRTST